MENLKVRYEYYFGIAIGFNVAISDKCIYFVIPFVSITLYW